MPHILTSEHADTETFEDYLRIYKLIQKTNVLDPKPEDVEELRRELTAHPRLWRFAGNTARLASDAAINRWNTTALVKESTKYGMETLRGELGYEASSPMERMLIEQVVLCWVNLNIMEWHHNDRLAGSHLAEDGLYWDRRLSTAQRRFTHACTSLARVRKLVQSTLAAQPLAKQVAATKPAPVSQLKACNSKTFRVKR
jgi:hypothetical protein